MTLEKEKYVISVEAQQLGSDSEKCERHQLAHMGQSEGECVYRN